MLLMIDNYDSFTYNLVQYFGELGEDVRVYRNDKISVQQIEALKPDRIVVSPGPCTPNEAGVSVEVIGHFARTLAGTRCLSRPPVAGGGIRGPSRASRAPYARQDVPHPARRTDDFPGPAESLRRDSLSFANCRASKPPVLLRGIRRNSRRRDHGHAPYLPRRGRRAVPSGIDPDLGRKGSPPQFPQDVTLPWLRSETPSPN